MRYRLELWLAPTADPDHLRTLLDAVADGVPAALAGRLPVAEAFMTVAPGRWALELDPAAWADMGTPLWLGLIALERQAGHEVWQWLGPAAAASGYELDVSDGGPWRPVYRVG